MTTGLCGTSACGAGTGSCQYPTVGTSCGTGLVCDGNGACVAAHGSQTFTETGSQQTFVVPAGVTSLTVDVIGAAGGVTGVWWSSSPGAGGRVQGTLAVTALATLYINVGGQPVTSCVGGFNGGGTGDCWDDGTSSGGGASDIRVGGTALSNRVVVAGGGGGSGDDCDVNYDRGGAGGGSTGGWGLDCNENEASGGTQSSGGQDLYGTGDWGALGVGGSSNEIGGGGGGGYYGGGGSVFGGGGGGSDYVGGLTSVTEIQGYNGGTGTITLSW